MSSPINRLLIIFTITAIAIYSMVTYLPKTSSDTQSIPKRRLGPAYSQWPEFSSKTKYTSEWYRKNCFKKDFEDVDEIFVKQIPEWSLSDVEGCKDTYRQFDLLYEVNIRFSGKLTFPGKFAEKVGRWLGNNPTLLENVHKQQLIFVYHPLTSEHVLYNSLRSKRPMPESTISIQEWVDKQVEETRDTCDFCKPLEYTALDVLGRHKNEYIVRTSNTFKLDRWHTLVIPYNQHHPLNFTLPAFIAFFEECLYISKEILQLDKDHIYPNLVWDSLYQGGVSQLHPHIHIMMTPDHYYGFFELMRSAGQQYFEAEGRNYFSTLMEIHEALGLTIHYGNSVAFPTLVGKSDMEVMFLSEAPGEDFYRLIFYTVQAYHDTYVQLCKGFGASYPAAGNSERAKAGRIPVVARLISRGDCMSPRTDYTSSEIFQQIYRIHDPWHVARAIREAIKKHDKKV